VCALLIGAASLKVAPVVDNPAVETAVCTVGLVFLPRAEARSRWAAVGVLR
jgi:hypothetical protein